MLSATAPTVETKRLAMRAFQRQHLDDYAAMWADPDVMRYLGGKRWGREESWSRVQRFVGHWALMGFGYWAVYESASGHFAGIAGFKTEFETPFGDAPEIGWAFTPAVWGKGYATEASVAALLWLDGERGRKRTVCGIAPENTRSLRVAEKLGYREFARSNYRGGPSLLFERL